MAFIAVNVASVKPQLVAPQLQHRRMEPLISQRPAGRHLPQDRVPQLPSGRDWRAMGPLTPSSWPSRRWPPTSRHEDLAWVLADATVDLPRSPGRRRCERFSSSSHTTTSNGHRGPTTIPTVEPQLPMRGRPAGRAARRSLTRTCRPGRMEASASLLNELRGERPAAHGLTSEGLRAGPNVRSVPSRRTIRTRHG